MIPQLGRNSVRGLNVHQPGQAQFKLIELVSAPQLLLLLLELGRAFNQLGDKSVTLSRIFLGLLTHLLELVLALLEGCLRLVHVLIDPRESCLILLHAVGQLVLKPFVVREHGGVVYLLAGLEVLRE